MRQTFVARAKAMQLRRIVHFFKAPALRVMQRSRQFHTARIRTQPTRTIAHKTLHEHKARIQKIVDEVFGLFDPYSDRSIKGEYILTF